MTQFMKRLVPTFDRVVVRRQKKPAKTVGGVILPETKTAEKTREAEVIAVGPGHRDYDGKYSPLGLNVGDIVLLPEFGGDEVELNGEKLTIFREDEIIGRIENTDTPLQNNSAYTIPDIGNLPKD
eukprot:TRINITY_DN1126_c0_g1_i1.p1 TRINITY_DN1126_c0_g1~~TRINITY_DN1126_c0_g1_i1.p1  ORF type:complete len:139 (+),score=49.83 TRINITY_DN1126_c0_g1_i1:44-418(+)